MISKNEKMNALISQRIIPAIIIAVIFIMFIAINRYSFYYSYNFELVPFWILRIFSLILISSFLFILLFELTKAYLQKTKLSILISFIGIIGLFVNDKFLINILILNGSNPILGKELLENGLTDSILKSNIFNYILGSWQTYIFILLLTIIFMLFRYYSNDNKTNYLALLHRGISFFLSIFVAINFIKTYIYLNTLNTGLEYIIIFFIFSVSYDTGGFFGGMFFGNKLFKSKMAPLISPKKTWEGAIIGYVFAILIALIFVWSYYSVTQKSGDNILSELVFDKGIKKISFSLLIIASPIFALLGDLYFSYIKRRLEIKDFSKILKGHGGILDRFDSVSFVFVLWSLIGIIAWRS
ncbi:phosphatidate cytidylyltransferase [Mycoplasma sp. CSL10137]|uniref:phosphatidate cytidylyltransferase n=1 Tax=unclassified Mycoplasma TaxID=2683645 RepID=UPI00197B0B28|nr:MULTISPECIES: phosphatidate cytidylyltransferase [unclassified Mycoplasma]MBN4083635.1 phosphatidate cytidylyltransferase [Mycoplasma sp. CSL10137]MBN4084080.1 phosphatidate cytidylyltransferase [Mycoplasma sp. CSL10166]